MLKITKQTESTKLVRVKLHGSFTGEYVPEVEKALSENGKKGKVALDLMNVTFVDREAMEFLRRAISNKKIAIENIPSYVTRWIEQELS
jgi:anti-anti-sigma regulatory factor